MPRCAPTVWDHEQDFQTTFFAACDHPPEVAEEVDASTRKKERKETKNDLPEPRPASKSNITGADNVHIKYRKKYVNRKKCLHILNLTNY